MKRRKSDNWNLFQRQAMEADKIHRQTMALFSEIENETNEILVKNLQMLERKEEE